MVKVNGDLPTGRSAELFENSIAEVSKVFLSKKQLAAIFNVSEHTVTAWRYSYSDFPARKIGKHVRFSLPEVLKWQQQTFEGK